VDKGGGKIERQGGSTAESRRDQLIHGIVHQLNHLIWKIDNKPCSTRASRTTTR